MNSIVESVVSIALAIVGLGIVATLVSKNAQTPQVVNAVTTGFGQDITAAEGPVLSSGGLSYGNTGAWAGNSLGGMFGS